MASTLGNPRTRIPLIVGSSYANLDTDIIHSQGEFRPSTPIALMFVGILSKEKWITDSARDTATDGIFFANRFESQSQRNRTESLLLALRIVISVSVTRSVSDEPDNTAEHCPVRPS